MLYHNIKKIYRMLFSSKRIYKNDYKYFKIDGKILDVPCGRGFFVSNDPDRIIGLDLNEEAINYCKSKNYTVFRGDALELPFDDASFSGIHCSHLIEHFHPHQIEILFEEFNRVLKNNGILVIRSPLLHKFFYNEISHIRPYPPSSILNLLNVSSGGDPTIFNKLFLYKFIDLKFYHRRFFLYSYETSANTKRYLIQNILKIIGILLSRIHINHFEKAEYVLVLKKTID